MFSKYQDSKSLRSLQRKNDWNLFRFSDVLRDDTKNARKIKKEDYLSQGSYPIIDQGKDYIAGFTNEGDGIYATPPLIVFGDHTRLLKYIDFPIFIGADGVKLLKNTFSEEEVLTKYIYYYLCTVNIPDTGYNRHFKFLKEVIIPIPNIEVQKRIVRVLDKAQELIDKRKAQIEALDQLAQSVFLEMFGDPVRNKKNFPKMSIKDIAKSDKNAIKSGPFGSALKKEFYVSKGYKIYGQEQVIRDDFSFGDYYIDENLYKSLESYKISAGDILISLVGTFGKISIVPEEFEPGIINPRLMKITLNQNIMKPEYFKYLFSVPSIISQIEHVSHGGTMGIINTKIMKNFVIPVPPLELQNKFINFLKKIQMQKSLLHKSLNDLEIAFHSLMHRAFKGELFNN
ncbi:type I restriction enzyme S subunit [Anoxybacillus voinovskiensis]|uniref:Type I restriction enzyme S subunit n=1 Tax=Anoxybacteroides voinovskiense TaxID=230470 RepID=A0A840DWF9_9BACL|nr:restriction endonuclease subunit S [Anoxybacillus voinovskiensis]MBB4073426.1 type I restriction enzyme S subunit [Anoxybacillus voinovskiensis]GGJ61330.1 hypothetical protein GCM10008982_08030 [Anoxybacillus voinovskiensis]